MADRRYSAGIVTAYGAAVRAGYAGTYAQFCQDQAEFAQNARLVAQYAEQASGSKTSAETAAQAAATSAQAAANALADAQQCVDDAEGHAEDAADRVADAEAYAIGRRHGADVGSTDVAYHNNAKYYAEQAASHETAADGSAAAAAGSASAAAASATAAEEVLESIPEDYTEMSEDVCNLKSAFDELDETVDELDETVIGVHLHEQLYDKTTNTSGGCLRADGTVRANTNYEYTDYIQLETGYTYVYTGLSVAHNFAYACFYDSSKTLMPDYSVCFYGNPATGTYTLDVPDGASYVRFSIFVGNSSTSHDDFVFYKNFDQNGAIDDINGIKTQLATLDTLKGKTALFFGDSICNGSSAQDGKNGWAGRIGESNSMTWHNYGYNGATITAISGHHCIAADVVGAVSDYPSPDYVILEGGTNDADNLDDAGIGTFTENDYSGSYDTTTFSGAFETMLYNAVQQWPHAQIGYISAHKMGNGNNRAMRRTYFLRAQELCKKWGIPFIDLWIESKLNRDLSAHYDSSMTGAENIAAHKLYTDGQHLTPDGYALITPQIEWWMRRI